jgi:hypothetical protein
MKAKTYMTTNSILLPLNPPPKWDIGALYPPLEGEREGISAEGGGITFNRLNET